MTLVVLLVLLYMLKAIRLTIRLYGLYVFNIFRDICQNYTLYSTFQNTPPPPDYTTIQIIRLLRERERDV